jgi:arginase
MHKSIEFIINKSEITAGTRGASLGPEAVMAVARTKGDNLFGTFPVHWLKDENYRLDQPIKYPFAKRIEGLIEVFKMVSEKVEQVIDNGNMPVIIAGDHGSAGGTIAGVKKAFSNKRLGVVWIDAHADLHSPYTTPSGNMHGMPLTTALAMDNLECKRNNIDSECEGLWESIKNCCVSGAKVLPEDLIYVAVRDTEEEEDKLIQRGNIRNYSVEEVRSLGAQNTVDRIKDQLKGCDVVYISFDVDSLDPIETSKGTGTPVENGLSIQQAAVLLTGLCDWDKTVAVEFVEINPCLDDKKNRMAEVAFELLKQVVETTTNN